MESTVVQSVMNTVYNLSKTGHGDYDHDWDDYIDFSLDKGLIYDSHDYTYGLPTHRSHIKPITELKSDMIDQVRKAIIETLVEKERIFDANMWIGSSTHYNLNLPCKIIRSRKFRGEARLINIVSKKDKFYRECYKAFIVGSDHLKYYVSPNCVKVDKEAILNLINQFSLSELLRLLDENIYGHWNFHPYNRHLFSFIGLLDRYTPCENKQDIRTLRWGWQVENEMTCESVQ